MTPKDPTILLRGEKKNWKLEAGLWEEQFENAAQFNARFEGQIEKMGELLHLCREAFHDIASHSTEPFKHEFWMNYVNEIACSLMRMILEAEDKHGLPVGPVAQADGARERKDARVSDVVKEKGQ